MRWLEIDALDRYVLQSIYLPVRRSLSGNRDKKSGKYAAARRNAGAPPWASTYGSNVCRALGYTDSTLRCYKEIGAGVLRSKELNPGLYATVLEIIEAREEVGKPHSALSAIRAAIRLFEFGEKEIPTGNPKKAREQVEVIDRMASILESLAPGVRSLGEALDPAVDATEARKLSDRLRTATRRLYRLRILLEAQIEKQQQRQELYATTTPEQDPADEIIKSPKEKNV